MSHESEFLKVFIELTSQCNENCQYCYYYRNSKSDVKTYMTKEQLTQINDKILQFGRESSVVITGGEPFINKYNLYHFLDILDENPLVKSISINTNATLMDENDILEMKKRKIGLFISLPSFNEEIFDITTNTHGLHKKLLNNIKLLVSNNCNFMVNTVVSNINIDHMEETYNLFYLMGGKALVFTHANLNKNSLTENNNDIFIEDVKERKIMLEKCRKLSKLNLVSSFMYSVRIEPCHFNLDQKDTIFNCACGQNIIFIDADGSIKPCGHNPFDQQYFGNIFDLDLAECFEILSSYKICNTKAIEPECKECPLNDYCNGGCGHKGYNDQISVQIRNLNITDYKSFMNYCPLIKNGKDLTPNCKYVIGHLIPPWEYISNKL